MKTSFPIENHVFVAGLSPQIVSFNVPDSYIFMDASLHEGLDCNEIKLKLRRIDLPSATLKWYWQSVMLG